MACSYCNDSNHEKCAFSIEEPLPPPNDYARLRCCCASNVTIKYLKVQAQ